ncbi:MAG: hypothetical protein ACPGN8_06810 [Candidatus Thalassarchaeaceae archaeon]
MTEDADEFATFWWEPRWYHDDKLENKLIEAIRAKDKPSTGAVYRISLFVCGILFFFAGWITWNIGLPAEGESGAVGMNLKTFLFFIGIFVQLIIAPYFAFISISNSGRLSPLVPKAQLEYFRLKGAISDREVHDHYWAALRDPDHEHHNEIIRYKWMDKVRWKHHPSDFFGYQIFTKSSGEETRGPIVAKTSPEYINSNKIFDENDNVIGTNHPFNHPLRRVITLPMFLFIFQLLRFPIDVIHSFISVTNNDWEILLNISISFLILILLGRYLIRRNTDLFNADADVSLEDLEERLRLLSERYLTIP